MSAKFERREPQDFPPPYGHGYGCPCDECFRWAEEITRETFHTCPRCGLFDDRTEAHHDRYGIYAGRSCPVCGPSVDLNWKHDAECEPLDAD